MKTFAKSFAFYFILFGVSLSSCQKEDFLPIPVTQEYHLSTGADNRSDQMEFSPCGLQDSNSVSITYRRKDGSLAPAICFTETALSDVLRKAKLSEKEIKVYLQNAFYVAKNARPVLVLNLGLLIAKGYTLPADYVADCFTMSVLGREGYLLNTAAPAETAQPILFSENLRAGFIDYYTIRQARSGAAGCSLVKEPGFSGVRFLNTVTYATQTVNITSLDSLRVIFRQAGFSPEATESTMTSLMKGEWSILSVCDLFQKKLIPNLPVAQALKIQSDAKNWRLSQVGIGLFASDASIESFYYARGEARIE